MKKTNLFAAVEQKREEILQRGDAFFALAELGFREVRTMEEICRLLESWDIPYEKGIACTGVVARLGKGKGYHIGIAADMDALPRTDGAGCIHSCGHSIQTTLALTVLQILQETDFLAETDGRVSVFFTPAEEFIDLEFRDGLIREGKLEFCSGKQNMIAQGYFDDVDCILSAHANGDTQTKFDIGSTLAGFLAKKAVFLGKAAHSGAMPHLGRNTLHGAMLCMQALSFLKEQFPPEAGLRLYPVLTEGGGNLNTIPSETILETYIRANENETLFTASERFDSCVRHCAEALALGYEIKTTAGYLPLRQSKKLNETVEENMRLFCEAQDIVQQPVSGASGDVGDLGSLLPTVQFGFSGIAGRFHSDSFSIVEKENCYLTGAKVLLGIIYDLLKEPQRRAYPEAFAEKKEQYLLRLRQNQ